MIKDFSAGYYTAEMSTFRLSSGPSIDRETYDYINEELYRGYNLPVTMRAGLDDGYVIHPTGQASMPSCSIGLPQGMWDNLQKEPEDGPMNMYFLKPEYAYLFYKGEQLSSNVYDVPSRFDFFDN